MADKEGIVGKNTIFVMEVWTQNTIKRMQSNLAQSKANNSGTLRQSLSDNLGGKTLTTKNDVLRLGITATDYWEFVDQGRPPGKPPPLRDILNWVKTQSKLPVPRGLEWAYAKTIRMNIAKRGTKGNEFATKVITPKRIEQLTKSITEAMGEDLIIAINGAIK